MKIFQHFELHDAEHGVHVRAAYEYEALATHRIFKTWSVYERRKHKKDGTFSRDAVSIEKSVLRADTTSSMHYLKVVVENPMEPDSSKTIHFRPQANNLIITHATSQHTFVEIQRHFEKNAIPLYLIGLGQIYYLIRSVDLQSEETTRRQLIPTFYTRFAGIQNCEAKMKHESLEDGSLQFLFTHHLSSPFGNLHSPVLIDYDPQEHKITRFYFPKNRAEFLPSVSSEPIKFLEDLDEKVPSIAVAPMEVHRIDLRDGKAELQESQCPKPKANLLLLDFFKTESLTANPPALRESLHAFFNANHVRSAHIHEQLGRTSVYGSIGIDFQQLVTLVSKAIEQMPSGPLHLLCFGHLSLVLPFILHQLKVNLPVLYVLPSWNGEDFSIESAYWKRVIYNFPAEDLSATLKKYPGSLVEFDHREFNAGFDGAWSKQKIDPTADISLEKTQQGQFVPWGNKLLENILLCLGL